MTCGPRWLAGHLQFKRQTRAIIHTLEPACVILANVGRGAKRTRARHGGQLPTVIPGKKTRQQLQLRATPLRVGRKKESPDPPELARSHKITKEAARKAAGRCCMGPCPGRAGHARGRRPRTPAGAHAPRLFSMWSCREMTERRTSPDRPRPETRSRTALPSASLPRNPSS